MIASEETSKPIFDMGPRSCLQFERIGILETQPYTGESSTFFERRTVESAAMGKMSELSCRLATTKYLPGDR